MAEKKNKPSWNSDLRKAYAAGYNAGYHSYKSIPNRIGTRYVAMNGFSKALKNARLNDKYIKNNLERKTMKKNTFP